MKQKKDKKQKHIEEEQKKSMKIRFMIFLGKMFWFIIRIPYFIIKQTIKLIKHIKIKKIKKEKQNKEHELKGKIKTEQEEVTFEILETKKGNFIEYLEKIKKQDSFIAITIGARGSGKTATSLALLELLKGQKENYYAMGFSQEALPTWISIVETTTQIKNNSLVVIDEGGILFSSRDSMSDTNKLLSDLLMISRHKNISIIFISQNSSNLEINTLRQADIIILKKHSLLQKSFERKIIAKIYEEYEEEFTKYENKKGLTLIYADNYLGFLDMSLPSFWTTQTSKSFENINQERESKKPKK